MNEVKDLSITNEAVRRKCSGVPNIEKYIATQQLTFVGKVATYTLFLQKE